MTVWRIAVGLARSGTPQARWRRWGVTVASVLGCLALVLVGGLVTAAHRAQLVERSRSPVWADDSAGTALLAQVRGLVVDGVQFTVLWLEPAAGHAADAAVVPPGLSRLPDPGAAVLSPELVRRGVTADDLGLAADDAGTGARGTIGADGLVTDSELLVYARPGQGRTLAHAEGVLELAGYRVAGTRMPGIASYAEMPVPGAVLAFCAWLVLLPALVLVVSAARAVSPVRTGRALTLLRLGVGSARVRALLGLEGAVLAVPGAAVAAAVGWWVCTRALVVPGVDVRLFEAQAQVPVWWAVVCAVLVTAVTAVASAWALPGTGTPRLTPAHPERTAGAAARGTRAWRTGPAMRWSRGLPAAVAVLLFGAAQWVPLGTPARMATLCTAAALVFVALPGGLPPLVAAIAGTLRGRSPAAWLAVRRLAHRSGTLVRPAVAAGLLVFIAGTGAATYAAVVAGDPDEVDLGSTRHLVTVSWSDARAGDVAAVVAALGAAAPGTGVLRVTDDDSHSIVGTCADFTQLALTPASPACTGTGTGTSLSDEFVSRFVRIYLQEPVLRRDATGTADDTVVVVRAADAADLSLTRALPALPGLNVSDPRARAVSGVLPGWFMVVWAVAAGFLVVAALREVVDRTVLGITEDGGLRALGLRRAECAAVTRWTLLPPLVLSCGCGWLAARLYTWDAMPLDLATSQGSFIEVVAATTTGLGAAAVLAAVAWSARWQHDT